MRLVSSHWWLDRICSSAGYGLLHLVYDDSAQELTSFSRSNLGSSGSVMTVCSRIWARGTHSEGHETNNSGREGRFKGDSVSTSRVKLAITLGLTRILLDTGLLLNELLCVGLLGLSNECCPVVGLVLGLSGLDGKAVVDRSERV